MEVGEGQWEDHHSCHFWGEFVDIDVEHLKKVSNETGSRMSQEAATHFQDIGAEKMN